MGRQEWKIPSRKTKEKTFESHHVQHYNCIELNATHYKIYVERGIAKWNEQAIGKILFWPKMALKVNAFR